jgi:hypothetical protein
MTRIAEPALWIATALIALVAGLNVHRVRLELAVPAPVVWTLPRDVGRPDSDSLLAIADRVAASDPFRLDRRPADVPVGTPAPATTPPGSEPDAARPNLALSGLVGGPPWVALLEGVPGHEGSVLLRAGDTLGGIKVRAVSATTATISGFDTTWKLTVKRPWP